MKFLRELLRKFLDWWNANFADLWNVRRRSNDSFDGNLAMEGEELLARYFVSKSKFSSATRKLKAEAFIPHPHREMSVFRIRGLSPIQSRQLGQTEFADRLEEVRALLGWGEFSYSALGHPKVRLALSEWNQSEGEHPRHRNVVGWPAVEGDVKATKAQQKAIALELSEVTKLVTFDEA